MICRQLGLVEDAQLYYTLSRSSVKECMRSGGHFLMANALQWHFGIHHQDDDLLIQARAAFADEGCPRPDRLLEVILPLPSL